MIVAIYVRVSTDQQAEKGYSLETQLAECRKKAEELSPFTVIEEFIDDGYSGAYIERPALDKLRQGLRDKRFGVVIAYDPDRLARNLTHQLIVTEEIENSEAQLLFVNFEWQDTPEGKLFYSIRGAVSAYEREKIKERSQRGKRGKALAGKVIRNNHPYGYDWDKENSIYVVNEKEARMIRQIFTWVVEEHLGIRAIATRLAQHQYPTRTNSNSWNIGTVHDIITRETYAGVHWVFREYKTKTGQKKSIRGLRDPSEWISVTVPPIVPREIWEAAQRQLEANKRMTKRPITYPYLCRNLVVCPLCGEYMRAIINGTSRKPYYVCKTGRAISGKSRVGGQQKCPARQIPAEDLDRHVWQYISDLLKSPEILSQEFAKMSSRQDFSVVQESLKRLQTKEQKLLQEREKVTLLFRQDLIDLATAEKQLTEIKESLNNVKSDRQRLQGELDNSLLVTGSESIFYKLKELISLGNTESPEIQRQVILSVVKRIEARRVDHSYSSPISGPTIEVNVHFGLI